MMVRIEKSSLRSTLILGLFVALTATEAPGAAFRLSFLDSESVLADTCELLKESGVSEDAAGTFRKLVTQHNKIGNPVNRTKFPEPQKGFYEFQDCGDLVRRLQHRLSQPPPNDTPGHSTLLCYDVVAVLLTGAGYATPYLEQDFDSKGIVLPDPGTQAKPAGYEAFRSNCSRLLWPEKYYPQFIGRGRTEAETRLQLSLSAAHTLADADPDADKNLRAAFAARFNALKRDGFVFTNSFQVGLVSIANLPDRFIKADHAFICIPRGGRLICLEKNGPRGPYIRAEFGSEEDLSRYASLVYMQLGPKEFGYSCPVVVSLNDRIVGLYRPAIRP